MFDSENDRLERINNAHLMLIGYLYKTIKEQDTEIAALKDQLRAKPVHGQELEAEIERLENEARDLRAEIGRLRNPEPTAEEIQEAKRSFRIGSEDHITKRDMDRAVDELLVQLPQPAAVTPMSKRATTDDTSNLRELDARQSAAILAENPGLSDRTRNELSEFYSKQSGDLTSERESEISQMAREDSATFMRNIEKHSVKGVAAAKAAEIAKNEQANGALDKAAVSKVPAQGRINTPVARAARRAMAIEERRSEGRA